MLNPILNIWLSNLLIMRTWWKLLLYNDFIVNIYIYSWIGNKFLQLTSPSPYEYINSINKTNQMTANVQAISIIISKLSKIIIISNKTCILNESYSTHASWTPAKDIFLCGKSNTIYEIKHTKT